MLGVASEALIFELADEMRARRARLQLPALSERANALETLDWLTAAFRERGAGIRGELRDQDAPAQWIDDLPGLLAEGNAIRLMRNESGHPTGIEIDRRQAVSLFVLFPALARAVSETSAALSVLAADG